MTITENEVSVESHGAWAKSIREAMKLTQQELADMVGITPREVDLFESNQTLNIRSEIKLIKQLWAVRNTV